MKTQVAAAEEKKPQGLVSHHDNSARMRMLDEQRANWKAPVDELPDLPDTPTTKETPGSR